MSAVTFEGVVEQGQIRLSSDVRLPDGTKVYIVVPDIEMVAARIAHGRFLSFMPDEVEPYEAEGAQ